MERAPEGSVGIVVRLVRPWTAGRCTVSVVTIFDHYASVRCILRVIKHPSPELNVPLRSAAVNLIGVWGCAFRKPKKARGCKGTYRIQEQGLR